MPHRVAPGIGSTPVPCRMLESRVVQEQDWGQFAPKHYTRGAFVVFPTQTPRPRGSAICRWFSLKRPAFPESAASLARRSQPVRPYCDSE